VAKVKKETGVTGERNAKAKGKTARRSTHGTTKTARRGVAKQSGTPKVEKRKVEKTKGRKQVKTARKQSRNATSTRRSGKHALAVVRGRRAETPIVRVAVKPLDPLRKCGPNTSVQFLYRVDEEVDGRNTPHLVFFDRHGWYCEHGRTCPAVGHAKKFNGQIARVS
jgi:hypothetical protein